MVQLKQFNEIQLYKKQNELEQSKNDKSSTLSRIKFIVLRSILVLFIWIQQIIPTFINFHQ